MRASHLAEINRDAYKHKLAATVRTQTSLIIQDEYTCTANDIE